MNIKFGNISSGGNVIIDGKTFTGNNISISNGKVTIDGITQEGELVGNIDIVVNGDCKSIDNQCGKVTANNVGEINTGSGDVNCSDVSGTIRTGSGDVNCGVVGGSIRTGSGDVIHR